MRSVVDRNVVMWRIAVCIKFVELGVVTLHLYDWKDRAIQATHSLKISYGFL